MLISFCSCCLHKLDDHWSLWKSLRATTPLVWTKSSSWETMNWKKNVELHATITSSLSDYISSHSPLLSLYVAEWPIQCWWGPSLMLRVFPPSLLWAGHTGQCTPLLCHRWCWLCAAIIILWLFWRAHLPFPLSWTPLHALWSAQCLLSFKQNGDQSSLASEAFTFNVVSCI